MKDGLFCDIYLQEKLGEITVFDGFIWLESAKGATRYECKKCKGIEVMGDFPNGSIWNLINHKCK